MTYEEHREAINEATKIFRAAQIAYCQRKINDDEFLAARAVYQEAEKKFDEAFAIAANNL